MTSVIIGSIPLDGHVAPMLGVARGLVDRGIDVRFITGRRFEAATRRTGARFIALPMESDNLDDLALAEGRTKNGKRLSGNAAMAANLERIFLDPAAGQVAALSAAVAAESTAAILVDSLFIGAGPYSRRPRAERPPVIYCGIIPLSLSSSDVAPFGLGLAPRADALGRLRNRTLNWALVNVLMRSSSKKADAIMRALSGDPLGRSMLDWPIETDAIAQFSVPSFEYPRSDAPATLRFIGPVSRLASNPVPLPVWWRELDGGTPVVHVSQGTLANFDFGELVLPAIRGLASEDVLVVVSTGGRPVESLGPLPANVRAATFLPYDALMPKVDVFVTNGGYGGLHYAFEAGVPIVAAGDTEDKVETTARVAWSGAGINLRTGTPSSAAVRAAVLRVLAEPSYRAASERIGSEIAASPGIEGLVTLIDELAPAV